MTLDELKRESGLVMAALKAQIEVLNGVATPVCMLHWPLKPGKKLQGTILAAAARMGEWMRFPLPGQLLDSGDAKRVYFGIVRDIVQDTGADGVIFGTDIWGARVTEEGRKHGEREFSRHVDRGFEWLVKKGWAVRTMLINVTAQSKNDVLLMQHEYQRTGGGQVQWLHDTETHSFPQDEFRGRQKMFGDLSEENLGEPPRDSPAEEHQKGGRNAKRRRKA